jgi:alkylation response protein AidB-like acyl-CoA dehydrogenase
MGGQDLPVAYEHVFAAEEAQFVTPVYPEIVTITLGLIAPTLAIFGSELQKATFIPQFLNVTKLVCQLFSEPGSGSDLASLSTKATRYGDQWIVNGQKVWTSGARQADLGLLIARTDITAPKHRGMTAFLLPLETPGVEIRPIRQMTGGSAFNEVFFSEVLISDEMRIGDEGDGWKVASTMLGFERDVSGAGAGGVGGSWNQVLGLARQLSCSQDPLVRQRLAHLYEITRVLDLTNDRTRGAVLAGQTPDAAGSVCKLLWTQVLTETSEVVANLLGPRLSADSGDWGTFAWTEHVLGAPGYRIAGGSDEIQRNIIGERILGLPREPPQNR